jgi:ParB-like chromosome segregation protein Spo0J
MHQTSAESLAAAVDGYNRLVQEASYRLPWKASAQPIARVQWVHIDRVRANDYNPNSVPHQEMKLLHTSIDADGYTQPVVAVADTSTDPTTFVIVDGFHRYTVMRRYADIAARTNGYLPLVVLPNATSDADRMASTVRHNRARGKHSIAGMGHLVFEMLLDGESDADICNKLGLEAEELARLKHITGYSKLYADAQHTRLSLSAVQVKLKADYHRDHPDEEIPPW